MIDHISPGAANLCVLTCMSVTAAAEHLAFHFSAHVNKWVMRFGISLITYVSQSKNYMDERAVDSHKAITQTASTSCQCPD